MKMKTKNRFSISSDSGKTLAFVLQVLNDNKFLFVDKIKME